MSGTPIIVNVTGGLQDQCGFNVKGKLLKEKDYIKIGSLHDENQIPKDLSWGEWVLPVWSKSITLNGSPNTPYIFDDRINHYDVVSQIRKVYKMGRKKRKEIGLEGREYMIQNFSSEVMCESMVKGIEQALSKWEPKNKFDLYKII